MPSIFKKDTRADKPVETGDEIFPVPAPVDPKQQWWYRSPDSKARKNAEKIAVMKAAGHTYAAIAKRLKTTEGTITNIMYLARKNGWMNTDNEPIDLEAELAMNIDRKVVRNIDASLDGRMTNWQTHEMTIAAAKGRGIFKNHETGKTDGTGLPMAVAIQIVMPPVGASDQLPGIDESQMGGTPAYVEGEVEDERTSLPDPSQPVEERGMSLVLARDAGGGDDATEGSAEPEDTLELD